ncbi:MAG: AAA family ATPase [Candidatus Dormibacteria bacterium]
MVATPSRSQTRSEPGNFAPSLAPPATPNANFVPLVPRPRLDAEALADTLDRGPRQLPVVEVDQVSEALASPTGLTRQASSFNRRDALQAWCAQLQAGADVETVERLTDGFLKAGEVVPLLGSQGAMRTSDALRREDGKVVPSVHEDPRFSTTEMLAVEHRLVDGAQARRGAGVARVPEEQLGQLLLRHPTLSAEQVAMLRQVLLAGDGVDVVYGHAGAGKTFALSAAREAWEGNGRQVIGCALAARAARELEAGSGIRSYTIDGLLLDIQDLRYGGLREGAVLVVDEAGMVGTRKLEELLTHAERARAKVVLVGDDKQLPEIDAGGAFRALRERLPAAELKENRRQVHGWERDALVDLREGRAAEAIAAYQARERVVVGENAEEVRRRMVMDWWEAKKAGDPGVMIAARKADVSDLNARARELLLEVQEVRGAAVEFGGVEFAEGDRIMTLRNSRGLGVTNGTRGDVLAVDEDRRELRIRTDEGHEVTLPNSYLEAGHVTHAYAITGHKAQGMTASRGFVLGDDTVYREWGYEAMSRGKEENRLYLVIGERDGEQLGPDRERQDTLSVVQRALAQSRAKSLAIELESPLYIRSALGERPLRPADRQRWSEAVRAIQRYRETYGVEDPESALGPRPIIGLRRPDYDIVAKVVQKVGTGPAMVLDSDIEIQPERGMGLSR